MPKTREEIESLQRSWCLDPTWDLEDTEGFEDHREELLSYRMEMEHFWANQEHDRLMRRSAKLGCYGNLSLVKVIENLEKRVKQLEDRIELVVFFDQQGWES